MEFFICVEKLERSHSCPFRHLTESMQVIALVEILAALLKCVCCVSMFGLILKERHMINTVNTGKLANVTKVSFHDVQNANAMQRAARNE